MVRFIIYICVLLLLYIYYLFFLFNYNYIIKFIFYFRIIILENRYVRSSSEEFAVIVRNSVLMIIVIILLVEQALKDREIIGYVNVLCYVMCLYYCSSVCMHIIIYILIQLLKYIQHSAPFPADFHFNYNITRPFPWEVTHRPILVSYVGSTTSYSSQATKLKTSLAHFCAIHASPTCVHSFYGTDAARGIDFNASHLPHLAYRHSVFCFQPVGDLPTRKGLKYEYEYILQ